MGQGVHAGGGGDEGREAHSDGGVQHGVVGNEGKVVDGVLVVALRVGDDGGQGGLAAGTGGGGYGDGERGGQQDLEKAPHLPHALPRSGDPGAHALGAVHYRAAPHSDDGPGPRLQVEPPPLLHVLDGGVRHGAVIYGAGNTRSLQVLLQGGGEAQTADRAVGNQQHRAHLLLLKQRRDGAQPLQRHRLPIGQQGQSDAEHGLKSSAIGSPEYIHGVHLFSLLILQPLDYTIFSSVRQPQLLPSKKGSRPPLWADRPMRTAWKAQRRS